MTVSDVSVPATLSPPPPLPPEPVRDGCVWRVMEVNSECAVSVLPGDDRVEPPPPGVVRWIDLRGQDAASLELLGKRFHFHPLALEDCAHFDQRPKVEEYGDYLFLVTHGIGLSDDLSDVRVRELHAFLGDRYLVTIHAETLPELETVWKKVAGDGQIGRRGADHLYYLLTDAVVDGHFPILDKISDRIEELELSVLDHPEPDDLLAIFTLRRTLAALRKTLSPQRDAFALLSKRGSGRIDERTALYFRDVYDHLSRLSEAIDTNRDLLGNTLDVYLTSVSNGTNAIMKSLTIMSAVFLPLAFIVGFFGQNFHDMPFVEDWTHSAGLMWTMVGLCVMVPAAMLIGFKRSGWW